MQEFAFKTSFCNSVVFWRALKDGRLISFGGRKLFSLHSKFFPLWGFPKHLQPKQDGIKTVLNYSYFFLNIYKMTVLKAFEFLQAKKKKINSSRTKIFLEENIERKE